MPEFPNFYENTKEANLRLQHSVVLYDKEPYMILCITEFEKDDILRVYMQPVGNTADTSNSPAEWPGPPQEKSTLMDQWVAANPKAGVLRKHMNSPHFNKFRPFKLGMCNIKTKTVYTERHPQRQTQQGLTQQMLMQKQLRMEGRGGPNDVNAQIMSKELRDTIMGVYPDPYTCLEQLKNPDIENEAAAFHREFALVRGPIGTLFLGYKSDVVACLPNSDFKALRLPKANAHLREVIEEMSLFESITVTH